MPPSFSALALRGLTPNGRGEAALIVATIVIGILVDQRFQPAGELFVGAWVWALMLWLMWRRAPEKRFQLTLCLAYATAGEVFLSLVWGLYDYRPGHILLFVPPGHVVLFLLGLNLARYLPDGAVPWIGRLAALAAALLCLTGLDQISAPMTVLLLLALATRRSSRLYCVMFVLALLLELFSTWIGNWAWRVEEPIFGLAALNPPFAAGAFYCCLDFLVISTAARLRPLTHVELRPAA
jgi:hypothetical protein